MITWLAAALLGGWLLGGLGDGAPNWAEVYTRVNPSVLPLQMLDEGIYKTVCSVTVIDLTIPLFLGAAHCDRPGTQRYVERMPYRVIYKQGDLMALTVQGRHGSWRAITIRGDYPRMGEEVASIGHAYGGEQPSLMVGVIANRADLRLDVAFQHWALENEQPGWIYFNLDIWYGVSGGPLVDTKGRLLTINSRVGGPIPHSPVAVSIAARPDVVRMFIEEARKVAEQP